MFTHIELTFSYILSLDEPCLVRRCGQAVILGRISLDHSHRVGRQHLRGSAAYLKHDAKESITKVVASLKAFLGSFPHASQVAFSQCLQIRTRPVNRYRMSLWLCFPFNCLR